MEENRNGLLKPNLYERNLSISAADLSINLSDEDRLKAITLLQHSYDDNYLISIIIGAGNTSHDFIRHGRRYNVTFGGVCSEEFNVKGVYCYPYFVPSKQFDLIINIIGERVGLIAIDWSVCCELKIHDIVLLMSKLNRDCELYFPYRNILDQTGSNFNDIIKGLSIKNQFTIDKMKVIENILNTYNINMELFHDNHDLKYPIAPYGAIDDENDLIRSIDYAKFSFKNNVL